jgi:hypothetical protein
LVSTPRIAKHVDLEAQARRNGHSRKNVHLAALAMHTGKDELGIISADDVSIIWNEAQQDMIANTPWQITIPLLK